MKKLFAIAAPLAFGFGLLVAPAHAATAEETNDWSIQPAPSTNADIVEAIITSPELETSSEVIDWLDYTYVGTSEVEATVEFTIQAEQTVKTEEPQVEEPAKQAAPAPKETIKPAPKAKEPVKQAVQEMQVEATAYTPYDGNIIGITAAGHNVRENPHMKLIAVDPNLIPLGTKVWVEGYGEAIAGDTGGAIKGKRIDVLMPTTEQALQWGRKTVTIRILK